MQTNKNFEEISIQQCHKESIIKKKIYPKWFIHFLCLFIPSSKNRKNLKKYIAENKMEYNKIENELYKIKQKEEELDKKLNSIIDMQNVLSQKLNWSIWNNISIHSHTETPILKIPDEKKTEFGMQKVNNQLCFNGKIIYNKPKICVITLVKSGTHFMGKILEELGFSNTNVFADDVHLLDTRDPIFKCKNLYQHGDNRVNIPFYLQPQLLQDGQFMLSHLPFSCHQYISQNNMLLMIRDLRKISVSYLRFDQGRDIFKNKAWFHMGINEEALLKFFDEALFKDVIRFANEFILWKNKFPDNIIKYEDIINENSTNFQNSINTISKYTYTTNDEVREARKRALNAHTFTYSGKPSTLKNIWTDKVEEKFISMGCDILNEQLGYPKEWNAENYPG